MAFSADHCGAELDGSRLLGRFDVLCERVIVESMVLACPVSAVDGGDCRSIRSTAESMVASYCGCRYLLCDPCSVDLFLGDCRA